MPNWTQNKITFSGNEEKVKYIINTIDECIKKDVGIMNRFVPRPDIYNVYDTTNHKSKNMKIGEKLYLEFDTVIERTVTQELIDKWKAVEQEQMDKYGVIGWYGWNCKYWGTKWDMCDPYVDKDFNYMECNTAWSAPLPFVATLARRFTGVTILLESAYEEGGTDAWEVTDKEIKEVDITDDFKESCSYLYEDDEEEAEC